MGGKGAGGWVGAGATCCHTTSVKPTPLTRIVPNMGVHVRYIRYISCMLVKELSRNINGGQTKESWQSPMRL